MTLSTQVTTLARGYGLIEGPLWLPDEGLLFSDVAHGGVFRLAADGAVECVVEHRRGIGGLAWHVAGGLIVSGRNIAFKPLRGGATVPLLEREAVPGAVGFNDLTTDAAGRIYVGSLAGSPFETASTANTGDLWCLDLDGSARIVGQDIDLTNGLGFSPDGRTLYHSDSRRHVVWQYPVLTNGDLGEKREFATTARGLPDGLAVAVDGSVWVALADGGHGVAVFGADGRERAFIEIPEPMCTSVCFGGADLRDLYIVSGSDDTDSDRGGAVHRLRVDVPGVPVPSARVRLPG